MPDRVVIRVPATVANLGPGFDCVGMAVAWYNEVRVERAPDGRSLITATGPGADDIPKGDDNMILRALRAATADGSIPVRIHQLIAIPPGRGFGSSAAAICAGLIAGRALAGGDTDLLEQAIAIEGHPDNVAPCLRGGVTVSGSVRTIRLDPPPGVRLLLLVSPTRLPTAVARAALGESVPRSVATDAIGRAAFLAAAIASANVDALMEATDDVFHQPQRFELMQDSAACVRALRSAHVAAFLSGAGPSVAALVRDADVGRAEAVAKDVAPDGWEVRVEEFDRGGASVVGGR